MRAGRDRLLQPGLASPLQCPWGTQELAVPPFPQPLLFGVWWRLQALGETQELSLCPRGAGRDRWHLVREGLKGSRALGDLSRGPALGAAAKRLRPPGGPHDPGGRAAAFCKGAPPRGAGRLRGSTRRTLQHLSALPPSACAGAPGAGRAGVVTALLEARRFFFYALFLGS